MTAPVDPQPGWKDDPTGRFDTRYWDGSNWTQAVMRDGNVERDLTSVHTATPSSAVDTAKPISPGLQATAPVSPPAGGYFGSSASQRTTSLSPQDAQAWVVQMLSMSGFNIVSSGPGQVRADFVTKGEPSIVLTVLLVFLWILPAIIYWMVKSRAVTHHVGLTFSASQNGTVISIQADQFGMQRLAAVLGSLPW